MQIVTPVPFSLYTVIVRSRPTPAPSTSFLLGIYNSSFSPSIFFLLLLDSICLDLFCWDYNSINIPKVIAIHRPLPALKSRVKTLNLHPPKHHKNVQPSFRARVRAGLQWYVPFYSHPNPDLNIGIFGLWFSAWTPLTPKTELASTLENSTLFQKKPEYRKALQVVSVPERVVQFRVVWEDDNHQVRRSEIQFRHTKNLICPRSKSTVVSASSSTPLSAPTRVVSVSTLP